jgi:hypothetical protein
MRGTAAALLAPLLFAAPAAGQKVTLPEKAQVLPPAPALVTATADGANVVWLTPDPDGLVVVDGSAFKGDPKIAMVFSAGKSGTFRLWAFTAKGDKVSPRAECLVTVGPPPPPGPGPGPGPNPPTPPVPVGDNVFPADGKARVLILYDNNERDNLPAGLGDILFGADFREALRTKTQNRYRIWPFDQDTANAGAEWADAHAKAVKAAQGKPFIAVSNGKAGTVGALPGTPAEVQKLLEKYGL